LQDIGVHVIGFDASHSEAQIAQMIDDSGLAHKVAMIYVETPANPTNSLIDIGMCKSLAQRYSNDERQVLLAVDNTYMGPLWCKPMEHGADLVLYSATKYLGGHSDLIAGAIVGSTELITQIKGMRTFLGNMPSPHTCWLLMRSLETLKIRMTQQAINAATIAESLVKHPMVVSVNYLGLMTPTDRDYDLYKRQYSSGGAMIAFTVQGGEKEAFTVLNHLNLIKLAVSLGGTESLAQHPASMTHAGLDPDLKADMGIGDNLIRLSIGIENQEDLMADIHQALSAINDAVLN
jgi:methionine-gamma-lyase